MRCKYCLCLDSCNMNEPQRISMKQNFPKLRSLLAIERSYGNQHWFCEKACDMAIGHHHYTHSPLKKSRDGRFQTGNQPHRLFGVSSKELLVKSKYPNPENRVRIRCCGGGWGTLPRPAQQSAGLLGPRCGAAACSHLPILTATQKARRDTAGFPVWWRMGDSNPRPLRCERSALTS